MQDDDIRSAASNLTGRLSKTEDPVQWRELSEQLVPVLIAYWDVHPHSAMEMLEAATLRLPLSLAHAMVRTVVTEWKKKPNYAPTAGGGADHCYLSALILSENFDLADRPWAATVLPQTLDKELNYPRFERMRDGERRQALVREIAVSVGRL